MKVLYVFGLQPQIWSDISDWSQDLHTMFNYFNNKQQEHKDMALRILDNLFDKTKHYSYFDKINFGSKQRFRHMKNPTLYWVILMCGCGNYNSAFLNKVNRTSQETGTNTDVITALGLISFH